MFTRNLNLLFNVDLDPMAGGGGDGTQEPTGAPGGGGGNPAWDDIRSLVDPDTFARLEPKLREWDTGVQQRIGSLTEKYKPFETLLNGRTPEYLQQAVQFADMLDKSPVEVYQRLGQYLESQGIKVPSAVQAQQQQQQALGPQEGQEDEDGVIDPRLAQLEQAQQQIMQMMQQQQRAELQRAAQVQLDNEIKQLREKHPELDDVDVQEVIKRAALAAQRVQGTPGARIPSLEEAYQELVAYQNRILNKPRPGDSAPQLVPPGGGASSGQQQKSWGSLSRSEMQDAVAALLKGNQGQ